MERLNKSLVKILSKLISDHRRDWAEFVLKAVLAYNTSVHESTGYTPYRLMFGRKAILPLDAVLKPETSPVRGDRTASERKPPASTDVAKTYYDTKCHGQQFQVRGRVWYRNRARVGKNNFLKPWCGPWKVVNVLYDVTYRIGEEIRKPGRHRQRRVVHFNYLKP